MEGPNEGSRKVYVSCKCSGLNVNICSIFSMTTLKILVFLCLMTLSKGCEFPKFVMTGSRPWVAIYKNEESFQGYFNGGLLTASKCTDNENCVEYKRKCISRESEDKYTVQHITPDMDHRYLCMQFIRRSSSIIQIKESRESYHHDASQCNDDRLVLDNWPLFTEKRFWEDKVPCPFVGGYDVRFSTSDSKQKCPNQLISPRLESECEPGDGIMIDFRKPECRDENLHMNIKQSLYCSATWDHGNHTFVILRPHKNDQSIKAWCMRYDKVRGTNKIENVHLFMDFVCDPGDGSGHVRDTTNYLNLEMTHKVVNSICADLSPACEETRLCKFEISPHCPKTCKFCDGDPNPCVFPAQLQGSWLQYEEHERKYVNISYYELNMSDHGRFQCYEEDDHDFENHTMLLQTFDNGCFPRFACLEINKPSPSTLEYRLGNRVNWPIDNWNGLKAVVCDESNFRPDSKDTLKFGKDITNKPATVVVDGVHHYPTFCGLDSAWFRDSQLFIKEKDHCDYCLIHDPHRHPKKIIQVPVNCSKDEHNHVQQTFKCISSSHKDDTTHALITRTLHVHEEYQCWVFVKKDDVPDETGVIYILDFSVCDKFVIDAVISGHYTPKKTYIIPKVASVRPCPYLGELLSTSTTPDTYVTARSHHRPSTGRPRSDKNTSAGAAQAAIPSSLRLGFVIVFIAYWLS